MTGGLLEFFTLEASEYVEQLDALVSRSTAKAPDAHAFGRTVRALRGSATMAKVSGIADLASGLERLAKLVRDGDLAWDATSRGVAISTIDDCKILIRAVRSWGAGEDALVADRLDELNRIAPARRSTKPVQSWNEYLASAAAEAAAGLLEYAENPGGNAQFDAMLDKVRALRGVAALADLPPLAEVVDAVDAAAKPIELGQEDATAERRRLFRTAARVLLEGGDAVRQGANPPTESVAIREFTHASNTLRGSGAEADTVIPIASLLAAGDDAIQAATNPPTTAAERFHLEVVSQAEHLRRLVADGRVAGDGSSRERVSRELRGSVRALARAAESFGALEIANLFLASERGAAGLESGTLDVLDRAALLLSAADASPETIATQFVALSGELSRARTPAAPATAVRESPRTPTPTPVAAPIHARTPTPTRTSVAPSGAALSNLLASGIAGLAPLADEHLAEPLIGDEDDVIPIDELTFRGKDALARAIAIGDQLRQAAAPPDAEALAELYDLLQLAAAE